MRKKTCIGTYDDGVVCVRFRDTFTWEPDDRVGVPGHWYPENNVDILDISILGVDVTISELPEVLQAAIWTLSEEVEWVDDDA